MTKVLNRIGDRLLEAVVPGISAAACCPPDPWDECDYDLSCAHAGGGIWWHCQYNCGCSPVCHRVSCCANV